MGAKVTSLPTDPAQLQEIIAGLVDELQARDLQIDALQHQLAVLRRNHFGRSSEKLDPQQLRLELKEILVETGGRLPERQQLEPAGKSEEDTSEKEKHGRRKPPEDLQEEKIDHDLPEAEKVCSCGATLEHIGEEVTTEYDYVPASFVLKKHVRHKYACHQCQETVRLAPAPERVFHKGMAGPGLLAYVVISKYADHLPLNRLEGITKRWGLPLSRSTMGDWVGRCARLLEPVVLGMKRLLLESRKVHTDDTPVPVLEKGKTRTGRLWVYVGDQAHPYVVFDYSRDRKQEWPQRFLRGYAGYLQCDAYGGYDQLFLKGDIQEVGCWAHVRRKFYDARNNDVLLATMGLIYIGYLFDIEKECRDLNEAGRREHRQKEALPVLDNIKKWLDQEQPQVLPSSAIGQAMGYAVNQWDALNRYVDHGLLSIDNNVAERELRHVVIGRNNWLFAGSDKGGHQSAILYSVIATCRRHEVEPWEYLTKVLPELAKLKKNDPVEHLLPDRWKAARIASDNLGDARPPP